MQTTIPTICRACHAGCAVLVQVDEGVPVSVKGDPNDPLYRGFCCVKGQSMADACRDEGRLLQSQKRQPDGSYAPIPVHRAMDEIAERIRGVVDEHGPRSVASYSGTMATNAGAANGAVTTASLKALGTRMGFNSNTIDQPGKMVAAMLFGNWMAPSNNFSHANVILLIGANPLVAMSGGIPHTNPGRTLTDALARGLKLIVVDPRRTETARRATQHLQVRPGEDVALLAGLLHVILKENWHDAAFVEEHMQGVDVLERTVAPFTPDEVARRAGVSPEEIIDAARTFATNGPGVATAGTGPNMSGHTTLVEYLLRCLNSVCGRWQRAGERVVEPPTLGQPMPAKAQAMPPMAQYAYGFGEKMRVRGLANTAAGMPTAALADEMILEGDGRVRVLISHGGNPVAAWPDQLKTLEGLRKLDLLVQIDTRMSATAREADYVIAVKHALEVPGMTLTQEYLSQYAIGFGTTAPYARYTPPVVEPPEESDVIEDWKFFYGLARRLGHELRIRPVSFSGTVRVKAHSLDMEKEPTTDDLFDIVTAGSRVSLDEVRRHPAGAIFQEPAVFVGEKEEGWEGRLDAGNEQMMADLAAEAEAASGDAAEFPLRLVSRRQMNVLNSTGIDVRAQNRGRLYNPAYMHPADLEAYGLEAGDVVRIRSPRASILGVVDTDAGLRRGIVSMSHSWGAGPDRDGEVREIGGNTGRLSSVDEGYERYTGLPRMSNIPVAISRTEHTS